MSEQTLTFSQQRERQLEREKARDFFDQRPNAKLESIWIANNTSVTIFAWNANVSTTDLAIRVRIMRTHGGVDVVTFRHLLTSDRVISQENLDVGIGWVLSVQVFSNNSNGKIGETYALLTIRDLKDVIDMQTITFGYVTQIIQIGYPTPPKNIWTEGRGDVRAVVGTNPAVGAEILEIVPTNAIWKVKSFVAILTTDATVSNRTFQLIVDDGVNEIFRTIAVNVQAASQVHRYVLTQSGVDQVFSTPNHVISWPLDIWLTEGFRMRTIVANFQAGDDWGAPVISVEEYLQQ